MRQAGVGLSGANSAKASHWPVPSDHDKKRVGRHNIARQMKLYRSDNTSFVVELIWH